MSRRSFRGWGSDLDDADFGAALAALGILTFDTTELRSDLTWLRRKLVNLREDASERGYWNWTSRNVRIRPLPTASELARAWQTDAGLWRIPTAIASSSPLSPLWLYGMLSAGDAQPFFPVRLVGSKSDWAWPLSIGILARESSWLRNQLMASEEYDVDEAFRSNWLATLTTAELDPYRCDLLISSLDIADLVDEATQPGFPDCSMIVSLAQVAEPILRQSRSLARQASAGVAVVAPTPGRAAWGWEHEWFRTFVRELSHNRGLLESICTAPHLRMAVANSELVRSSPLERATLSLGRALQTHAAEPDLGDAIDLSRLPADVAQNLRLDANELYSHPVGYFSERGGATETAKVSDASQPAFHRADRHQASTRFIRARVSTGRSDSTSSTDAGFVAGEQHTIEVSVGRRDAAWVVADERFPDEALPPNEQDHRLTVVLSEPNMLRRPLVEAITLPRYGPSSTARFHVDVPKHTPAVEARISILHRGRVLQTAILSGGVSGPIRGDTTDAEPVEVRIESVFRPGMADLDNRRRFHRAVILNRAAGESGATCIDENRAIYLRLAGARGATRVIGKLFGEAERDQAFGRALDSNAAAAWLRRLAIQGRILYQKVGSRIERLAATGQPLSRIQILTFDPDSHLPLEATYDLPPPQDQATLCSNWQSAVERGVCNPSYHEMDVQGLLDVVCPSGFWGLSKIIERHSIDDQYSIDDEDPRAVGKDVKVCASPMGNITSLAGLTPVLFACSDVLNAENKNERSRVVNALKKLTATNKGTFKEVRTWTTWSRTLKSAHSQVLILLSHTEVDGPNGLSIHIGAIGGKEVRALGQITTSHVNPNSDEPGPLVMLLGCDTAVVPQDALHSAVSQFHAQEAGVIVGTIAPVLGRHAGRMAEALVEELQNSAQSAAHKGGAPMSESILQARRRLFSKGILVSLAVTSYGDADWRLPPNA